MAEKKTTTDSRWVPADVMLAQLMADVGDDSPQSLALVRKLKRERLKATRKPAAKKRPRR
jgi:hypothetical protein